MNDDLYDENATVTIGMPSTETPRAPSQNRLSEYAIVTGDIEEPNKSWTTRAEVREVKASDLKQFRLSAKLNQSGAGQTYSIFFHKDTQIPDWVEPELDVYCKLDYSKQAISGKLAQRAGMTPFAIENHLSTAWTVTETT